MHNSRLHFLDTVKQELQLPEINADACVHSYFDQADCQACVDACPTEAWILDDDGLGLDTNACDGCGLCVPACNNGALHVHFPWVIRPFGGQMIALFACEKSGIDDTSGQLPCLHAIGLKQLLLLYNSGIKHLLTAAAECTDCSRQQTASIHQRVEQLNTLLLERNKAPMKILQRSPKVWTKIFQTDEVIARGTQLSKQYPFIASLSQPQLISNWWKINAKPAVILIIFRNRIRTLQCLSAVFARSIITSVNFFRFYSFNLE